MRTVYLWDIILHHWAIDLWHFTGLCTSGISYCIIGQSTYGISQDCVPLGYHTASLGNRLRAFHRTVYLWDIILHHWAINLWHFTGLCTSGISYCIIGQSTYGISQDCVPLGYHTASLGNRLRAFYRSQLPSDAALCNRRSDFSDTLLWKPAF